MLISIPRKENPTKKNGLKDESFKPPYRAGDSIDIRKYHIEEIRTSRLDRKCPKRLKNIENRIPLYRLIVSKYCIVKKIIDLAKFILYI
jgi:hypothetical protein